MAERWSEALAQVFDRPIRPLGGSGNQKYLRRIVAAKLVFDRLNEVFVTGFGRGIDPGQRQRGKRDHQVPLFPNSKAESRGPRR